jgi:hypothetical protein
MSRSRFRSFRTAVVTSGLTAALASTALAQEPAPVPAPVVVEPAPVVVEPAPLPPPAPVESPAPYMAAPTPQKEAEPTVEPPAEEKETPWYDSLTFGAFVDAYGALRSDNNTRPQFGGIPAGGYYHEAYVQADGFALAFAGLDVNYATEKFGATMSLRFGPGVNRFYAADQGPLGIDNITQAFVTYKPTDRLTFDLGQFGTIYGAEVLESWKNMNYSRGALYYAMQPFWHTGLRANIKVVDQLSFNVLVVNGVNNAFENNKSPSLGLQAVVTPHESLTVALGYLGALNPRDDGNGPFQNFYDVVATYTMGDFKLVANADLNTYKNVGDSDTHNWWGVSLAPGYAFNEFIGASVRYEYLSDSANLWGMTKNKIPLDAEDPANGSIAASKSELQTITLTADIKPVPGSKSLIIRPEFRYEIAGDNYFYNKDNVLSDKFWTAVIGVVVATNP